VESIWPALGPEDATVRHAARVALEAVPVPQWREKALSETQSTTGLTAGLALARVGSREDQGPLLQSLARWTMSSLNETDYLIKLRVIEVSFARHGIPDAIRPRALEKLSAQFPTGSPAKDRELLALLAALNAPDLVAKTLALRDAATTQEDQMAYQAQLRIVTAGWTPELRQRYFLWFGRPKEDPMANRSTAFPRQMIQWFSDVGLKPSSGYSFDNYLRYLRQEAFEKVPDDQKAALAGLMSQQKLPQTKARFREKVRDWTTTDLQPALGQLAKGRDFLQGQSVYQEARCDACHRFDGVGGSTGPDLTGVGSRYSAADLLKSILEPDASVPPQFQTQVITLKSGDVITGAIAGETPEALEVVVNPLSSRPTRLLKVDIRERATSPVSPMPGGLLNHFSQEEILDLLAFLQSGGNPDLPAFGK
jgi:putative heme-binding domain-containing protein